MGYKTWADNEVLEAADLNGYIAAQTVPRFATTGARAAALGAPAVGMLSYVTSVGLAMWNGSVWAVLIPVGGTTGQVLAKASGADFDLEWVTP